MAAIPIKDLRIILTFSLSLGLSGSANAVPGWPGGGPDSNPLP
jgi:hypothetical protein